MARDRYWKLTPDDLETLSYDKQKLLNWDIKLVREPEEDAIFVGVFLYQKGTPLDYESVKGITMYHNHIDRKEIPEIVKFLKKKFNGSEYEKGERIFLKGSDEIFEPKDIKSLAKEMESEFNGKATITLEFESLTDEERKTWGLPDAKRLPIPT